MTHVAGTTFGFGSPSFSTPPAPWGFSPFASQGLGFQPSSQQPPYIQQTLQLLQVVPQQLQQLQFLQHQQSQQLQWLLQIVPAQLQQLQQLIQIVPQQLQQLQQQPFGTASSGQLGFGLAPQIFGGQTAGHVM